MHSDEIYKFRIKYINEKNEGKDKTIFSDNTDIYSLSDLPEGTYCIIIKSLKDSTESQIGEYLVGTPLGVEEVEKEIKLTENSHEENYHAFLKNMYNWIKEGILSYTIFRKQGKLLFLEKNEYPGEIIGEVHDGRVFKYPGENIKDGRIVNKPNAKIENKDNDNYISLE